MNISIGINVDKCSMITRDIQNSYEKLRYVFGLHRLSRRVRRGELPEGQEKVHWGYDLGAPHVNQLQMRQRRGEHCSPGKRMI